MRTRKYYIAFISFIFLFHIILVASADAANKIMPLGDSITKGTTSGVALEELQVSYRKALYDKLKAAGYVVNDEIFVGTLFSGESVADFDPDHDGHDGFLADQIALPGNLDNWLATEEPNIVLLHIGTNDISGGNENAAEIEDILAVIDTYELNSGKDVWVILALIIDRDCSTPLPACQDSLDTTALNNAVTNPVFSDRQAMNDKIVLVDMQTGAGIIYDNQSVGGDMWDDIHPFANGYAKMADLWFSALMDILPQADAGLDQSVNEFETVTLRGAGSSDPKSGTLTYQWEQTAGTPIVVLSDDTAAEPTFDAPDVGPSGETLTFTLTVTDEDELVSTDTVTITVQNPTSSGGGGGGGGGGGCFIASAANGSAISLHGKMLDELRSQFTMMNWKRRMSGDTSLQTLSISTAQAASPVLVAIMVGLFSASIVVTLSKLYHRRQKLYHQYKPKMSIN